ncbi:uncharacterized protein [Littorina saxatilis]|uniref:Uncharacterized protein n=1 Tax=Littorina saxatilis TaxID=31220 RepID=A0AAN9AKL7_9CAEN
MAVRTVLSILRFIGGIFMLSIFTQVTGEQRCVCMVDQDGWFFNFDLLKFKLPLPCTYRMTRLRTSTGCDMTVNLVMSQGDVATKPAAMTYLVSDGSRMTSGAISTRGVGVSDPQGFDTIFYPPSAISMNGVEVFCYTDDLGFKSALFPSCAVSLHYQSNGYLGIYSRNTSDDFSYSRDFLCGNCDGGKDEMRMLGSDVLKQMKSWEDRTAAMLYYSSLHIVGGNDQCMRHVDTLRRCPANIAYKASQVCGCILSAYSHTGKCMRKRTTSRDRTSMYYACVQQYCVRGGSRAAGCSMVQQMLRRNACPLPGRFSC